MTWAPLFHSSPATIFAIVFENKKGQPCDLLAIPKTALVYVFALPAIGEGGEAGHTTLHSGLVPIGPSLSP